MRLWHKDLIPVLPNQQLVSQWRECCAIARNISVNGTPNHLLVNKILNYPILHFVKYTSDVCDELTRRGYNVHLDSFNQWIEWDDLESDDQELFEGWHDDRYLTQCYYNLQEKYDCGGISDSQWKLIQIRYERLGELNEQR